MIDFFHDSDFPATRRMSIFASIFSIVVSIGGISIDFSNWPDTSPLSMVDFSIGTITLSLIFLFIGGYGFLRNLIQFYARWHRASGDFRQVESLHERVRFWPEEARQFREATPVLCAAFSEALNSIDAVEQEARLAQFALELDKVGELINAVEAKVDKAELKQNHPSEFDEDEFKRMREILRDQVEFLHDVVTRRRESLNALRSATSDLEILETSRVVENLAVSVRSDIVAQRVSAVGDLVIPVVISGLVFLSALVIFLNMLL